MPSVGNIIMNKPIEVATLDPFHQKYDSVIHFLKILVSYLY